MINIKLNNVRMIAKASLLGAVAFSATATAEQYECMLIRARPVTTHVKEEVALRGDYSVGEVIIEGNNFGSNPVVYFGPNKELAHIINVASDNTLDSITLKFPEGTPPGTYKLIIQNTTGPFRDNDGILNPIFCFGSVTVGILPKEPGS